jgi:PmbA protein
MDRLRVMLSGRGGVSAYEIYILRKTGLRIETRLGECLVCNNEASSVIALRVLMDGRLGIASVRNFDPSFLEPLIDDAISSSQLNSGSEPVDLAPMTFDLSPSRGWMEDPTYSRIETDEKLNKVQNLEAHLRRVSPLIPGSGRIRYKEQKREEWLWTPGSPRVLELRRTRADLHVTAVASDGSHWSTASAKAAETQYYNMDWAGVARSAAQTALVHLAPRRLDTGNMPVIFSQRAAALLVAELAKLFRGDVHGGRDSWFFKSRSKAVFGSTLHLLDDPHFSKRPGSLPWDADGSPTQRLVLIESGHPLALAHNRASGVKHGAQSTGHSLRVRPERSPEVGFHNVFVEPSHLDLVDLLRRMGRGLHVSDLWGLESVDRSTGEFCLQGRGSWVEDGQQAYSVAPFEIRMTLKELFARVEAVGRDLYWGSQAGSPSLLCGPISVAG